MIEPALLYLYLTALIAVYLSPGPDMALVLAVSASQGRRAGLSTVGGIAAARTLHVLGSGLGLAALFVMYPYFQTVVRVTGAVYLFCWVLKMLKTPLVSSDLSMAPTSVHSNMLRGFLTNLLNPKALLFCSLLFPQFTSPDRGALLSQFILLGGVLVSIGLLFDLFYVFLAGGMVQHLGSKMCNGTRARLRLEKVRNWLMIIVMGGMAVRLLLG